MLEKWYESSCNKWPVNAWLVKIMILIIPGTILLGAKLVQFEFWMMSMQYTMYLISKFM